MESKPKRGSTTLEVQLFYRIMCETVNNDGVDFRCAKCRKDVSSALQSTQASVDFVASSQIGESFSADSLISPVAIKPPVKDSECQV